VSGRFWAAPDGSGRLLVGPVLYGFRDKSTVTVTIINRVSRLGSVLVLRLELELGCRPVPEENGYGLTVLCTQP